MRGKSGIFRSDGGSSVGACRERRELVRLWDRRGTWGGADLGNAWRLKWARCFQQERAALGF